MSRDIHLDFRLGLEFSACPNVNIFDLLRFDTLCQLSSSQGDKMNSTISDVALDLGVFALDNESETYGMVDPCSALPSISQYGGDCCVAPEPVIGQRWFR